VQHTTKHIAKNASVLLGSQVIMWLLTMALTIVMPRYLGAAGVGKIQFATSLWMMIAVITAFGTDLLLTKEIARQPDRTSALFGSAIVLRFGLFTVGYSSTILALWFFGYPSDTISIVCLIGISHLIRQFVAVAQATLQGLERMEVFSLGEILSNALYTFLGITLLLNGWSIYAITALMIVAPIVNLAIQLSFLSRLYKLRLNFEWQSAYHMLQAGWPYLLSSFFLVAYMQVDIIIISALVDERAIGWYSAADRLFGTFLFIPAVYITAAFPVFSRMFVDDQSGLQRLISKSFDMLFLLSVPIGFGLTIIANPLVALIFGAEFANSGPILAVLGIVLILTYQNILIGRFLISMDRQNAWTIVMAVATVATIPLDMAFIPWCETLFGNGALGGALAFVVTELGMLLIGLKLLPSGALTRANLWTAVRVMTAGIVMMAVVWQFEYMFIGIPILIGAVSYIAIVLLLRVIPKEDFELLYRLVQQVLSKLRRPQPEVVNS
jgi:O-antigen/teichoic acid export membrane protein